MLNSSALFNLIHFFLFRYFFKDKCEKKQKVFQSMKGIYEKAIKVNNDLKLNVDEQQDDIKHLK